MNRKYSTINYDKLWSPSGDVFADAGGYALKYLSEKFPEKDILECFNDVISQDGVEPIKKNMGIIIKMIKGTLPNADGKLVATTVQKYLS